MGSLAVWHWAHGAELVPAAGTLPGCLKLWGDSRVLALGQGDIDLQWFCTPSQELNLCHHPTAACSSWSHG